MTGVEILATQEVATAFGFCWPGFIIPLIIAVIFGCLIYFGEDNIQASIVVFIFAISAAFFTGFVADGAPIEYETQYKVTISDEVSMNDFLDKYEIVSQEGKIYTVRERND